MGSLDKLQKKVDDKVGLSHRARLEDIKSFDATCDVCGASFQWPETAVTYPIPLNVSGEKPPRSILDVGGWCMKCKRTLCPAEADFIPYTIKGNDWWVPGCRDCHGPLGGRSLALATMQGTAEPDVSVIVSCSGERHYPRAHPAPRRSLLSFFGKKIKVLGLPVSGSPPVPIGEIHAVYAKHSPGPVVFEGAFPLLDSEGRYLCKSCGIAFDAWNPASAQALLRKALLNPKIPFWGDGIGCPGCSRFSVFSAKDVVTGLAGDPFGSWKDDELALVEKSLTSAFNLTERDLGSLAPRVHAVFFLYR